MAYIRYPRNAAEFVLVKRIHNAEWDRVDEQEFLRHPLPAVYRCVSQADWQRYAQLRKELHDARNSIINSPEPTLAVAPATAA